MFRKLLELLSDSAVYGLSTVLGQLAGLLLLPLYTRFLTPADYGVLAMLGIVTMLFGTVANLAIPSALFRRYHQAAAAEQRRRLMGTGLISTVASSALFLGAGLLAAGWIADAVVGDAATAYLVGWTLLQGAFANVGGIPIIAMRVDRRVRSVAVINLLKLVLTIGVTIGLVVGAKLGVLGVMLAGVVVDGLAAPLVLLVTRSYFAASFDLALWRGMISYCLPMVPHRLLGAGITLFGQYVVRNELGLEQAGLYAIAMRFAAPISMAINAVQEAWGPYKFYIHAHDENPAAFFRSTFSYYVAAVVCLWGGLCFWGPELLRWMTPAEFHSALALLWAVALVRALMGVYFMMGTGIEMSEDTRPYFLVSLFGLVAVVAGTYGLVPLFGAHGAALASAAGWGVMAVTAYWLAQHRFAISYDWPLLAVLAVVGSLAVGGSVAWQPLALGYRLTLAAACSLLLPVAALLVLARSSTERPRITNGLRQLFRLPRHPERVVAAAASITDSLPAERR